MKKIVGIAITEPSAGTDAGGIKTTAVHKGNKYVLNGEKSGISVAMCGDAFVLFAKTEPEWGKSRDKCFHGSCRYSRS
ncbi:acyl-CoA dehydrogenase family protein [Peribacillus frigoritolerans]|nr:acyl-CoA dehydrogenase family protein [Peribacillus frigoritolerans]